MEFSIAAAIAATNTTTALHCTTTALHLLRGAGRDVADGPAGLLANVLLGVVQHPQQRGQRVQVDHELRLWVRRRVRVRVSGVSAERKKSECGCGKDDGGEEK